MKMEEWDPINLITKCFEMEAVMLKMKDGDRPVRKSNRDFNHFHFCPSHMCSWVAIDYVQINTMNMGMNKG